MKKFMKFCALTALVLIALGMVLGTVGQRLNRGPVDPRELFTAASGGERENRWEERLEEWGERMFSGLEGVDYELSDSGFFAENHEVLSGDVEHYPVDLFGGVRELVIEAGACDLTLAYSTDGSCYVEAENAGKFQVYAEDGQLVLKSLDSQIRWNGTGRRLTLYLPGVQIWEEVGIELGAGRVQFDGLSAREISLEADAGQIQGKGLSAEELDIEAGAGSVELTEAQTRTLEAKVSAGSLEFQGDITGSAELECSMGNIGMTLLGKAADFDYVLQGAMGSLVIDGQEYNALAAEKRIANGASKQIGAEYSMGNIEIRFE